MITNKFLADINIAPINGYKGIGPLGLNSPGLMEPSAGVTILNRVLTATIGVMTIVAIIWFTFTLITGAIGIMSSGGDKGALENNKKKITNALIGLLIVITSVFIVDLIGFLIGIDILKIGDWVPILWLQII